MDEILDHQGMLPDYYAVLGVTERANFSAIEAAYWKRAFQAGADELAQLNEAYEVLGSDVRRQAYNEQRTHEEASRAAEQPASQPTRIARNGQIMTSRGRINIKNTPFKKDFSPLDAECPCFVCKTYTRAYLSHLFRAKELSAFRLLTIHNLTFSLGIMQTIRDAIRAGTFIKEKDRFLTRYNEKKTAA